MIISVIIQPIRSLHCFTKGSKFFPIYFFLDSTLKPGSQQFLPDFQETLSESLVEKLNNLSFAEERMLCSVIIERDQRGSLGLQITEGSDGNVYIQSVIPGGPACKTGNVQHGDQVVAVDGVSLLGVKYTQALNLLKNRGNKVEFVLARLAPEKHSQPLCRSRTNMLAMKETVHIKNNAEHSIDKNRINYLSAIDPNQNSKLCESPPLEKHLTESCRDTSNFHKYGLPAKYHADVPYHKHIRYEIDSEKDNFKFKTPISAKCFNSLSKHLSKSCSHIFNDNNDKAVIVEMIPKDNVDPSEFHSLDRKYLKQFQNIERINNESASTMPPIALPRSLGLGRKWRGPVRYPVTPVKNVDDNDADSFNYISTSDEEQVFI